MDDRTYGVELEFNTARQGGLKFATQVIRETVDRESKWYDVSIGFDGSEIEVRSPVMQGADDMEELKAVMDALRKAGCKVTHVDGMHVHHGAQELIDSRETRNRVYQSWYNNQDAIHAFVAKRRDGSDVCARVGPHALRQVLDCQTVVPMYMDRYYNLNIRSLGRAYKTVELRLHQGSLQSATAEAWVEFGKGFLNRAIKEKRPMPKIEDPREFLDKLELPDHCGTTLLKNAARRLPKEDPVTMDEYVRAYGGAMNGGTDE